MLTQDKRQTITDILTEIKSPQALREISQLVTRRLEHVNLVDSLKYRPGQKIKFTARGNEITGTIKSVNRKTLTVDNCSDNGPGWRVSFSCVNEVL